MIEHMSKKQAKAEVQKLAHPAANIFPMMSDSELDVLAKDIAENGQNEGIIYLHGKIIDGRNRWVACEMIGKEDVWEAELEGDPDPVAYVLSQNLHRRHLTESQRSMVAARTKEYHAKAAKERQKDAGKKHGRGQTEKVSTNLDGPNGRAIDHAAKSVNVSPASVASACTVLEHGSAELAAMVDSGKVAVSKAAKIAKSTPKKDQAVETEENRRGKRDINKPFVIDSKRKRDIANKTLYRLRKMIGNMTGYTEALPKIDLRAATAVCPREEAKRTVRDLTGTIAEMKRFRDRLEAILVEMESTVEVELEVDL